jgi:hypothetical protein
MNGDYSKPTRMTCRNQSHGFVPNLRGPKQYELLAMS